MDFISYASQQKGQKGEIAMHKVFRKSYLFFQLFYFFPIKFRKLNILLNNFIFPSFFGTFIGFPLFPGFLVCLGVSFWVYLRTCLLKR